MSNLEQKIPLNLINLAPCCPSWYKKRFWLWSHFWLLQVACSWTNQTKVVWTWCLRNLVNINQQLFSKGSFIWQSEFRAECHKSISFKQFFKEKKIVTNKTFLAARGLKIQQNLQISFTHSKWRQLDPLSLLSRSIFTIFAVKNYGSTQNFDINIVGGETSAHCSIEIQEDLVAPTSRRR